jgi:hypothetical protein
MCTELILAFLYFSAILIVNYFLYKLLINYFSRIIYLLKVRNIFMTFKSSSSLLLPFLYNFSQTDSTTSLKLLNTSSSTRDIFIIGNTYKYLLDTLKNKNTLSGTTLYYFQLLQNQYLSNILRLK